MKVEHSRPTNTSAVQAESLARAIVQLNPKSARAKRVVALVTIGGTRDRLRGCPVPGGHRPGHGARLCALRRVLRDSDVRHHPGVSSLCRAQIVQDVTVLRGHAVDRRFDGARGSTFVLGEYTP